MLIALTTLLATRSAIFRSRAAIELEAWLCATKSGCCRTPQESARNDLQGPPVVDLSVPPLSDWRSALAEPETVIAWHRAGFRLFWTWKVRHGQPGRPVISREVRVGAR